MKRIVIIGNMSRRLFYFRRDLINALQSSGHKVYTIAPDDCFADELREISTEFYIAEASRVSFDPIGDIRYCRCLRHIIGNIKPHKVLAYGIKPIIYGSVATYKLGNMDFYAMVTGLGYPFGNYSVRQRLISFLAATMYRYAMKYTNKVVFQNRDDINLFIKKKIVSEDKIELVEGSGVDTNYFSEAPIPNGAPIFLLAARLLREKGIPEYVLAAAELKKIFPDVRFQILGPLDENPSGLTMAEIERYTSSRSVEYLGETYDVKPYIQACTVFVLPSYYREGVPKGILEAMSTGRPIITCDSPGCRETVREGINGYLVPIRNVPALIGAMRKMIEHPEILPHMGNMSRKIVSERFEVKLINAEIMRLIGA